MMKSWLLLAAARAAAEDLAFVREGCRISIHGARAILRDGARECDLWNAQSSGRRCASDRVLLCEVVFADQQAAASTHAALTVATDAAYLAASAAAAGHPVPRLLRPTGDPRARVQSNERRALMPCCCRGYEHACACCCRAAMK